MTHRCREPSGSLSHGGLLPPSTTKDSDRLWASDALTRAVTSVAGEVFGEEKADIAFHAKKNWEAIKHEEKKRKSRLDGVPLALPALTRAQRLQEKASYAGVDWDNIDSVWEKLHEEIDELREADKSKDISDLEEEIGDVLFSVVNLARDLKLDSEDLLRRANSKFINRFKAIEK